MAARASMFKVLVADDHPVFRGGLRSIVEARFQPCEVVEAGDMPAVRRALAEAGEPDLLLLDVCFPGFDIERDLPGLRGALPVTPIAIVSMISDAAAVRRFLALGANGFISKSIAPDGMAEALKAIAEGEQVVRQSSGPEIAEARPPDDLLAALSPRQLEVLQLVCRGLSNKEIARELGLSPFTVRLHVSAMMATLNVSNRAAAAAIGSSRGLV